MSWTDERVDLLAKLWAEGKSASEISKILGQVSRNAVIGKIHRLGLVRADGAEDPVLKKPADQKEVRTNHDTAPAPASASTPIEKDVLENTDRAEDISSKIHPAFPSHGETPEALDSDEAAMRIAIREDGVSLEMLQKAQSTEQKSKRLKLMQLTERTCKWPVGNPATDDFWFCGHPSLPGKPYCEAHAALAFQSLSSKRDRR